MAHGGKRDGAGRKTVSEEVNSRELAITALKNKFGDLTKALEYLLSSEQPQLIKFAYEHAFGKPVERIATLDEDGNTMPLIINWMKSDEKTD